MGGPEVAASTSVITAPATTAPCASETVPDTVAVDEVCARATTRTFNSMSSMNVRSLTCRMSHLLSSRHASRCRAVVPG